MADDKKAILDQVIESLAELRDDIHKDARKMMTDLPSTTSGGFYEVALQSLRIAAEKIGKRGHELSDELFNLLATLRKLSNEIDNLEKSRKLIHDSYEANYELLKSVNKLPD